METQETQAGCHNDRTKQSRQTLSWSEGTQGGETWVQGRYESWGPWGHAGMEALVLGSGFMSEMA